MIAEQRFYATGKRKTAVARVWLQPGAGRVVINRQALDEYIDRETAKMVIFQPLVLTGTFGKMDVSVNVHGGGNSGQAGAIRHGISRAMLQMDEELRSDLKKAGFLTRDPRMKERKKYGLKAARRSPQFSKR